MKKTLIFVFALLAFPSWLNAMHKIQPIKEEVTQPFNLPGLPPDLQKLLLAYHMIQEGTDYKATKNALLKGFLSCRRVYYNDPDLNGRIILALAKRFTRDPILVAFSLNTHGAMLWLKSYLTDIKHVRRAIDIQVDAAKKGDLELLKRLNELGITPRATRLDGMSALIAAVKGKQPLALIEWLVAHGADVNAEVPEFGYLNVSTTPLTEAAIQNDTPVLLFLLKHKANPNIEDTTLRWPIHWAAGYNNIVALKALVKAGANINARDNMGDTALKIAKRQNKAKRENQNFTNIIRYLRKKGAEEIKDELLF